MEEELSPDSAKKLIEQMEIRARGKATRAPNGGGDSPGQAALSISYAKNWLQPLLVRDARAQIDNGPLLLIPKNGTENIVVQPGDHNIKIWVPYLGFDACIAEEAFNVADGAHVLLTYKTSPLIFLPGSIIRQVVPN